MHSSQLLTLSVKHEGSGASSMEYVVTAFSRGSRYICATRYKEGDEHM